MGTSLLKTESAKDNARPQCSPGLREETPEQRPEQVLLPTVCPCGGGCPRCAPVQAKLEVGAPDDPYEREADAAAKSVLQADGPAEPPALSAVTSTHQPRRLPEPQPLLSPAQLPEDAGELVPDEGRPLPDPEKNFFEPRLGRDLSAVRVHDSPQAADQAARLQARAYTLGPHVVFGSGRYQPGRPQGRELLAHELAHVVQQRGKNQCIQRQTREEERAAWSSDVNGSSNDLLSGIQGSESKLGGIYPYLPTQLKQVILAANLEMGIGAGFMSGLAGKMDPKDFEEIDRASKEHPAAYNAGGFVGLLKGAGMDIWWNLEGLWDLGKLGLKLSPIGQAYQSAVDLWERIQDPAGKWAQDLQRWEMIKTVISGLWDFQKYLEENPSALLIEGREVGHVIGEKAGAYLQDDVVKAPSPFDKGMAVGFLMGVVSMEIVLLLVSWEKLVGRAAGAAANVTQKIAKEAALALKESEFGMRILKIMERTPGLSKIAKAVTEAEEAGKAAEAARLAKAEEETRRAAEAERAARDAESMRAAEAARAQGATNVTPFRQKMPAPSTPAPSVPSAPESSAPDNLYQLFEPAPQSMPSGFGGGQQRVITSQVAEDLNQSTAPFAASAPQAQPRLQLVPPEIAPAPLPAVVPAPVPATVTPPMPATVPGSGVVLSSPEAAVVKAAPGVAKGIKPGPSVKPSPKAAPKPKEPTEPEECPSEPNPSCPSWIPLKTPNALWKCAYTYRCGRDLMNWRGFGRNVAVVFYTHGNQPGEIVMENEGHGGLHSEARIYWELKNRGFNRDCRFTILGYLTERRACPSCQTSIADLCRLNHGAPFPVYYLVDYWNAGGWYDTYDHVYGVSQAYAKAGFNIRKCEESDVPGQEFVLP